MILNYRNRCRTLQPWLKRVLRQLWLLWLTFSSPVYAGAEQTLTGESIATTLQQYIVESGPWKAGDVEVRVAGFKPLTLPSGTVKLRILKPAKGLTPGMHSYLIGVDVNGKEVTQTWARAEVRVYANVVVSSAPLAHHESINAQDVRVERRDITSLSGRTFTRISDVTGKQAARPIEVNEILTQSSVDLPKLIRRGGTVVLLYETSSLRVESPGVAEEPGRIGDMIQVKNPTSGKLMRGIVLDGRTVKVN
jgi:flagella basal body P-ring formation protein FlgA